MSQVERFPLRTLARITGGGTPTKDVARYWDGDIPWVSPKDMWVDEVVTSEDMITPEAVRSSATNLVPKNTVLCVVRSGILARKFPVAITRREVAINQDIKAIIPCKDLDGRYLYYFLKASAPAILTSVTTGATVHRVSTAALTDLLIPLPPVEEQRRIVAALDEAFAAISIAAANAQKIVSNAREILTLLVTQIFNRDYPKMQMKSLCYFENGDRGENYAGRAAFVDEGVPVINAGHLTRDGIDAAAMNFITRERYDMLRSGKIRRGDFLFCLRGSLGKFARNDLYDEGAIASSLIIIRPNEGILPAYLGLYLSSELCLKEIKHYQNGTAQPNLGGKSLEKFLVPVPALEEQQLAVAHLQAAWEATREMERLYLQKRACLAELKEALLHRAFAD